MTGSQHMYLLIQEICCRFQSQVDVCADAQLVAQRKLSRLENAHSPCCSGMNEHSINFISGSIIVKKN